MAKTRYKVPISLDRSSLDHEITLEGKGMRLKPLPVKVLAYWFLAFVVIAWILVKSPFSGAPIWMLVLLGIWLVVVAVVMGKRTGTGEFTFMQLPALIQYLPPTSRKIMTRSNSRPFGFMSIVGIKEITPGGIIRFTDGDIGQLYSVVGSASRLLFDRDRDAIMDRVNGFYQKIDTECSWIQITTKESQRVYQQLAGVEVQNRALKYRDPDLDALLAEKFDVLKALTQGEVGEFESLHQYILVRGPNMKALKQAHKTLVSERSMSSLFLRRCELLKGEATLQVFSSFYRSHPAERAAL